LYSSVSYWTCLQSSLFRSRFQTFQCNSGVCGPFPTYPTSPSNFVYEGGTCNIYNATFCHPSLTCVNSICQKRYSGALGTNCTSSLDCIPGALCYNNTCSTQTSSKVVGASCTYDSDCNSQNSLSYCLCTAPGASSGICSPTGGLGGPEMTAAAVTSCQAVLNTYKTGTITSSNAATAYTNFLCVESCAFNNGLSTIAKAWQANNGVAAAFGTYSNCSYTTASACASTTTAASGGSTTASGSNSTTTSNSNSTTSSTASGGTTTKQSGVTTTTTLSNPSSSGLRLTLCLWIGVVMGSLLFI